MSRTAHIGKRIQASLLAALTLVILATTSLPQCGGICCSTADEPTMQRPMPCCETPSLSPREPLSVQAAKPAGVTGPILVAALESTTGVAMANRVEAPRAERHETQGDGRPAVFLLNTQFRI